MFLLAFGLLAVPRGMAAESRFSHETLDRILRAHVRDGQVDYEAIRRDEADALSSYLTSLSVARPEQMARDDRLAFWLNAYTQCLNRREGRR